MQVLSLLVRHCPQNGIEHPIQILADVFNQETQHEAAAFLQKSIFPAVAPVGLRVRQVLWPVQFHGQVRLRAVQVNFHFSFRIELDGQSRI